MGVLVDVALFIMKRPFVFAGHVLIHRDRLAIHVGPAAGIWIFWVKVRVARQMLTLTVEKELAEGWLFETLGGDVCLDDPALVRLKPVDRLAAENPGSLILISGNRKL